MQKKDVSFFYLFWTFLKIGVSSFGGFIALVAIVQRQLAEKDKVVSHETILDGISLTSILPGPLAVNTVAYVGYKLRGVWGSLISIFAVVLPSFVLMCILAHLYFTFGQIGEIKAAFKAISPAVFSIILAVSFQMGKKNITDYFQTAIALSSSLLFFLIGGVPLTFALFFLGGVLGYFLYYEEKEVKNLVKKKSNRKSLVLGFFLVLISIGLLPFFKALGLAETGSFGLGFSLLGTFSSLSISLFGGGYVFIPVMQEVIVENYEWLLLSEFTDGIALGQITPGPIMITSTFIGYKVMGLLGAFLSTVGMFLPPSLLTVVASHQFELLKGSSKAQAILKGVRPVVVGMIVSAAFILTKNFEHTFATYLIAGVVLYLSIFTKLHSLFFILGSGLIGLLFF